MHNRLNVFWYISYVHLIPRNSNTYVMFFLLLLIICPVWLFDSNPLPMIYGSSRTLTHLRNWGQYYIVNRSHGGSPWHNVNRFWLAAGQIGWTVRWGSSSGPLQMHQHLLGVSDQMPPTNKLEVASSGTNIWPHLKWKVAKHSGQNEVKSCSDP